MTPPMNDKELLEAAAKAAGWVIETHCADGKAWVYEGGTLSNDYGEYPIRLWNPLTDDGDAFRLLIVVKKWVSDNKSPVIRQWSDDLYRALGGIELALGYGDIEKLRRDIVIAAAEISLASAEGGSNANSR